MASATLTAAALLVMAAPAPSQAFTQQEIDAAARKANQVRSPTRQLASDKLAGRDNATPGSEVAQALLIPRLARISDGLNEAQTGDDAFRQSFVQAGVVGTNLLGVIRGRELPDQYVIVGAHFDHLGTRSLANGACSEGFPPGGEVCNGATDNATGVAAVLAIGAAVRALPQPPRRSVVLALWDAEEDGLLGSLHYVNNPLVPLEQTVAYVNFDILGANLLPSLRDTSFLIGSETGGTLFQDLVDGAVGPEDLRAHKLSFIFGQGRSDYVNFVNSGIPTVFFSDSTGGCYHTTGDDTRFVNFKKLKAQSRSAFRLIVELAETSTLPGFTPPLSPLATFDDAVAIDQVLTTTLSDLSFFGTEEQASLEALQTQLAAIVSEGPGAFDLGDVVTVLNSTLQAIDLLAGLDCQRIR